MISKETFVNTMNSLMELDDKMNAVDSALKALDSDFCGFYMTEPASMVVALLAECMEDENDWLGYFVWERDWLRDMYNGAVTVNGEPVKIENWADVYDFIVGMIE